MNANSVQFGHFKSQATTLHNLGRLKANTGEIEDAIALYQQSLAINEQIGNIITFWRLGGVAEQQGDYNKALDYLQPVLEYIAAYPISSC